MQIDIPMKDGLLRINADPGRPIVLIGPNGAGKSRLGIYIDSLGASGASYRIAAQRSLELPDEIFSDSYERALQGLRPAKTEKRRRETSPGTIEHDYDQLLTALFAEHYKALENAHIASAGRKKSERPTTAIDRLQQAWRELIPNRRLQFSNQSVRSFRSDADAESFHASQLSDGERLIIYVLGQALLLAPDGLLVIDEPELHMSRALLSRLWDLVEEIRPDCSFLYITHDVHFAGSRQHGQLFAVLDYIPPTQREELVRTRKRIVEDRPPCWVIEPVQSMSGLPREILVRILGSRKPILFVEGKADGFDQIIYKVVYRDFTIIPVESCGQVIRFVRSFKNQQSLHWLHCAGLIDKDDRDVDVNGQIEDGIYGLPVREIENLLLLPQPFLTLAQALFINVTEANRRLADLESTVFDLAERDLDQAGLRYTSSKIWESDKNVGVKASDISTLVKSYNEWCAKMDPEEIYGAFLKRFKRILSSHNYEEVLAIYKNKGGLMDKLGKAVDQDGKTVLVRNVTRLLSSPKGEPLIKALAAALPKIVLEP